MVSSIGSRQAGGVLEQQLGAYVLIQMQVGGGETELVWTLQPQSQPPVTRLQQGYTS